MIAVELLMLLAFALYFLVSISVMIWGYRYAQRRWRRGWLGGFLSVFLMYNLLFWDWIPVLVMHKYYCAKEAGFWVYKSPEQWVKENPEEKIVDWNDQSKWRHEVLSDGTSRYWPSKRVYGEFINSPDHFYAITREEQRLIDSKTNLLLAKSIEFKRGGKGLGIATSWVDYKIWLAGGWPYCGSQPQSFGHDFVQNSSKFLRLSGDVK